MPGFYVEIQAGGCFIIADTPLIGIDEGWNRTSSKPLVLSRRTSGCRRAKGLCYRSAATWTSCRFIPKQRPEYRSEFELGTRSARINDSKQLSAEAPSTGAGRRPVRNRGAHPEDHVTRPVRFRGGGCLCAAAGDYRVVSPVVFVVNK